MGDTLLDRFRAASKPTIQGCAIGRILAALDPPDRADLEAALAEPSVTHVAIADVLTGIGHKVSAEPVGKHRRTRCACYPRDAASG